MSDEDYSVIQALTLTEPEAWPHFLTQWCNSPAATRPQTVISIFWGLTGEARTAFIKAWLDSQGAVVVGRDPIVRGTLARRWFQLSASELGLWNRRIAEWRGIAVGAPESDSAANST